MKKNPYWVEFIGLPGSGKTTISSLLLESLKKSNHGKNILSLRQAEDLSIKVLLVRSSKIFFILNIFPYKLRMKIFKNIFKRKNLKKDFERDFVSHNNDLFKSAYSFINKSKNKDKELILRWFRELISVYQLIQSNLNENYVVLVDEGFVSRSLSIFCYEYNEFENKELLNYLNLIPAPSFILNLDISLDESIKRLEARGYPTRMKKLNDFDIRKLLEFLNTKIPIITKCMESRSTSFFKINNEKEKAKTVSKINEALKTIFIEFNKWKKI